MGVFSPFRNHPPDTIDSINRESPGLIATAIFEALDGSGCLNARLPVDRRINTVFVITEAIGHVGEPPDAHRPGHWVAASGGLDLRDVANAVYENLAYRGYL